MSYKILGQSLRFIGNSNAGLPQVGITSTSMDYGKVGLDALAKVVEVARDYSKVIIKPCDDMPRKGLDFLIRRMASFGTNISFELDLSEWRADNKNHPIIDDELLKLISGFSRLAVLKLSKVDFPTCIALPMKA